MTAEGGRRAATGEVVLAGAAVALALTTCTHRAADPRAPELAEAPGALPEHPVPAREPFVRVGLAVGADSLRISSGGRIVLVGHVRGGRPDGGAAGESGRIGTVRDTSPAGGTWRLRPASDGVRVERVGGPTRLLDGGVRFRPADGAPLRLAGRPYRGLLEVRRVPGHRLVAVNEVDLEAYLRGVVPVEIGPREPEEVAAVRAQAVAARTYAVRNLGRRDSLGFDVFGTIEDQAYGGLSVERPEVDEAVRATAGEVIVHRGQPIRAYYHSTGGGHTARVTDVWNLADAPYLRRIEDRAPDGADYCSASPRYRWEERWTAGQLERSLRGGLARYFGADSSAIGSPRSVRVLSRAPHGRVTELEVRTDGGRWVVTRNDIRFTLRTPDGRGLRSTRFRVVAGPEEADGGLRLEGRGFGHGIGMCQWGAIGRARAGQSYREILGTYYRGTRVVRAYGIG